jgi:hypothetical protein
MIKIGVQIKSDAYLGMEGVLVHVAIDIHTALIFGHLIRARAERVALRYRIDSAPHHHQLKVSQLLM